jgi:putative membrane protein insertion efficiency factor
VNGRRRLLVAAVLGLLVGLDLGAAPDRQLGARATIAAIHVYQRAVSPLLAASSVRCRFEPTCSHYAVGALERDGLPVGGVRAVWRVLRCAPWTPRGTVDPP